MTKIKSKKEYLDTKKRLERDKLLLNLLSVHSKALAYGLTEDAASLTKSEYKYFDGCLDHVNSTIEYLLRLCWGYDLAVKEYESNENR